MSRKTLTLVFPLSILSLVHLSGCGVFSTGPDGKKLPIEGNIVFNIREGYTKSVGPERPVIQLGMRTEKSYPCANYEIRYNSVRFGNLIMVNLKEIFAPDICLTAFGCAGAALPLNLSNGDYLLQIGYKNKFDRYHLIISDTAIQIVSLKASFATPESTLIWRYPPNSFSFVCANPSDSEEICQSLLDSLFSAIPLQEIHFPPYGQPCYRGFSSARYFRYSTENDFKKIGEIMRYFWCKKAADPSRVYITFWNWLNEQYNSWSPYTSDPCSIYFP